MAKTVNAAIPAGGPVPNLFAVGTTSDGRDVVVMRSLPGLLTVEEARNLAAYLVAVTGGREEFLPILDQLEDS